MLAAPACLEISQPANFRYFERAEGSGRMQLGVLDRGMDSAGSRRASAVRDRRYSGTNHVKEAGEDGSFERRVSAGIKEKSNSSVLAVKAEGDETVSGGHRSQAIKIYQAAAAGKANPINSMRQVPKVPYGHLAKDGVIEYNGVIFVCDEKTNSICLGNVEDKSQVITVTLSGGGHLKVNRKNIGDLAKAVGMFSPEDLNLIMRAIAQDTKIQSVKKEIDDMENSIGSAESAISGEAPADSGNAEETDET